MKIIIVKTVIFACNFLGKVTAKSYMLCLNSFRKKEKQMLSLGSPLSPVV